jgi:hypothetical protein
MTAPNEQATPVTAAGPGPVLTVVRGNPSAEQIAALVAVLAARAASAVKAEGGSRAAVRSEWSARSRLLRAPLRPGSGGWRASARPR